MLEHDMETDAPYLPRPGDLISTPANIPAIGRKVAEIKGTPDLGTYAQGVFITFLSRANFHAVAYEMGGLVLNS